MALFQFSDSINPTLESARLMLRPGRVSDFEAWAKLRSDSRAFLTPWEPQWPSDDLHRSAFRERIRRCRQEINGDEAYPLLLFRRGDGQLLGGLTLGLVRRGVAQACTLGYWMGAPHAGKGYMSEAVRRAMDFAFGDLGLSRVEAACLPRNERSIHLLESVGFSREGMAPAYLKINGAWEDHLLFALMTPERRG